MTLTQGQLWASETEACQHPMLSASAAYRYGCRCHRCRTSKLTNRHGLPPTCHVSGCDNLRLKGRRYCDTHNPSHLRPQRERREGTCEICGKNHGWYESQIVQNRDDIRDLYRRVCSGCRQPYSSAIKSHRLNVHDAIRLIQTDTCELCHRPISSNTRGRKNVCVDHDHSCCPGARSCGHCVRGFLCVGCNTSIGHVEAINGIGIQNVLDYIARARLTFSP